MEKGKLIIKKNAHTIFLLWPSIPSYIAGFSWKKCVNLCILHWLMIREMPMFSFLLNIFFKKFRMISCIHPSPFYFFVTILLCLTEILLGRCFSVEKQQIFWDLYLLVDQHIRYRETNTLFVILLIE